MLYYCFIFWGSWSGFLRYRNYTLSLPHWLCYAISANDNTKAKNIGPLPCNDESNINVEKTDFFGQASGFVLIRSGLDIRHRFGDYFKIFRPIESSLFDIFLTSYASISPVCFALY
jgi:hypothetical protein